MLSGGPPSESSIARLLDKCISESLSLSLSQMSRKHFEPRGLDPTAQRLKSKDLKAEAGDLAGALAELSRHMEQSDPPPVPGSSVGTAL